MLRQLMLFRRDQRGSMLTDVAKASAIIAFLSVVAANFVSTQTADLDSERLSQVASAASRGHPIDPMITGSISRRANETRLDPCVVVQR